MDAVVAGRLVVQVNAHVACRLVDIKWPRDTAQLTSTYWYAAAPSPEAYLDVWERRARGTCIINIFTLGLANSYFYDYVFSFHSFFTFKGGGITCCGPLNMPLSTAAVGGSIRYGVRSPPGGGEERYWQVRRLSHGEGGRRSTLMLFVCDLVPYSLLLIDSSC